MNRIKEIIDKKGIKQIWLAEQLDKSYNMINSYVQNRRQPSLEDLFKIANILKVDVRELLDKDALMKNKQTGSLSDSEDFITENAQTIKLPLIGNIACGTPILAVENIEAEIPVSIDLIKGSSKHFLLKAVGNSMNKAGINDGDFVLVKQQNTAENGNIVVALIDDEATIKELHKTREAILLKPHSTEPEHKPIILNRDFKIQGIVITTIPSL
jgi:repressor LexA